jgi:hypothetical protein
MELSRVFVTLQQELSDITVFPLFISITLPLCSGLPGGGDPTHKGHPSPGRLPFRPMCGFPSLLFHLWKP